MKILIIEDDQMTLNLLKYSIERLGHKAFVAESGEKAITMLGNDSYDLIISDVMMPGLSGLSLVSVIRSVNMLSTPIIMMSALSNKPLLDAAFEAGANDFLAKPFTMEELEEKLKINQKV
jgi:DNA-binding response OmpR family regulator